MLLAGPAARSEVALHWFDDIAQARVLIEAWAYSTD
jgi:hypothetical protein